jgi:hypothetical protein
MVLITIYFLENMNKAQSAFFFLYFVYLFISFIIYGTSIALPLRLLTTFVHEFSHAGVCWLTGGSVHQIEVYSNAAGVTRFRGGCRCLISSAGYLGEAIWGMFFVIMSGGRKTSTAAASVLIFCLLTTLCYSPNRTMVVIALFYSITTSAFLWIEWYIYSPLIQYVILFYGVFMSFIAIVDIFGHTVAKSSPGSDAYSLYEEYGGCCFPRCVGFTWFICALLLQISAFILDYMLLSTECENKGWFECLFATKIEFHDWRWDWSLFL